MMTQGDRSAAEAISYVHNADRSRYEALVDGRVVSLADYIKADSSLTFSHTETADDYAGRGIASGLVKFALDDVLAMRPVPKVIPACPFVAHIIDDDPAYDSLRKA